MNDLRALARALGGEVAGRQVVAPGPGHTPRDRSLSIKFDPSAPDGFLVHSHCGDDWQVCRDYVRQRLGLPAWEPGDDREQYRTIPGSHLEKWDFAAVDAESEIREWTDDEHKRIANAVRIWNEAEEPYQTPAEDYLLARRLDITDELASTVLRFHPRTPWRDENTGHTARIPCLIAAFRSVDDDAITAIHRIRVDRPERWPKTERRMLGVVHRVAVKLSPASDRIVVGEGVETCMAVETLGHKPARALGSIGAISFFPVLDGVAEITFLVEAGTASLRHVKICGRRWREAGRRVLISRSTVGSDHNDALMREQR
jgi:putative DNA primase/helicase